VRLGCGVAGVHGDEGSVPGAVQDLASVVVIVAVPCVIVVVVEPEAWGAVESDKRAEA